MLAQEEYVEAHALRSSGDGRLRLLPGIWEETARQCALTFWVSARRAGGGRWGRIRSRWSRLMFVSGWARIPTFGRQHCSTKPRSLGYEQSYVTFARKIRERGLRPVCGACSGTRGRAVAIIDHPAGEECQWDWLELRDTPWGSPVFCAGGCPVAFGQVPGVAQSASQDQPHLVEGLDEVLRRFGGTARRWRVDRMATVLVPGTDRLQASFVGVAKHYGVGIDPCPPRRPNRKGAVEKAIHYIAQRWWRTAAVGTVAEAQDSLDRFCVTVGDARRRDGGTVGKLADAEPLLPLPPVPYPAEGTLVRKVAANGLVSVWGNRYSLPPSVIGHRSQRSLAAG